MISLKETQLNTLLICSITALLFIEVHKVKDSRFVCFLALVCKALCNIYKPLMIISIGSFLVPPKLRNSLLPHTFTAEHFKAHHSWSNECQAVSAVKFEIQLRVKEMLSVYKTYIHDVLWNRLLAVLLKEERRGEGEGCNCHIKVKEFKINLISQSLSPPKRFIASMLCLVARLKESTESEMETGRKRRDFDRGNRLAPNQSELVWEGSNRRSKSHVMISALDLLYLCNIEVT